MTEQMMMDIFQEKQDGLPFINLLLLGGGRVREKALQQYEEDEQVEDDLENWTLDVQNALENLVETHINYWNTASFCKESKNLDIEYATGVILDLKYEGFLTEDEIKKAFEEMKNGN